VDIFYFVAAIVAAIVAIVLILSSVSMKRGRAEAEADMAERNASRLQRFQDGMRKPLLFGADLVRRMRDWGASGS
jgi:hypothetical protein